jgi:threonine synthase
MAAAVLTCIECGAVFEEGPRRFVCEHCAPAQEPGGPVRGLLRVRAPAPAHWPAHPPGSLAWRRAFLPLAAGAEDPLGVGGTPLLAPRSLRRALDTPRLWLKDETRNPSASAKDRASWLTVEKARQYGLPTVATASTGNAATALAACAAAVGLGAVVFVPAAAPPAKLAQIAAYGALLLPVLGSYDEAYELCGAACARWGWFNRSTALNPWTIEGKKTAALEIAAQLAPQEPDRVVVPCGDGVILAGLAKGFSDLETAGLIRRRPRLLAVQPAGSAALTRAWRVGDPAAGRVTDASSCADSLCVGRPRGLYAALDALHGSQGDCILVSEEEILAAIGRLATLSGVFAEPAAAAGLAGLEGALASGLVDPAETIVLLITGHGLKDPAALSRSQRLPDPVPAELGAVARRLGL